MTDAPRLFGTDGVRGTANRDPLTPEFVTALGRAAARVLAPQPGLRPTVILGRDTRLSGPLLESALAAGLASEGLDVHLAGVVPSPAVACLTQQDGASFGAVITASHNPFEDNGVKFFRSDGYKLDDDAERAIEIAYARRAEWAADPRPAHSQLGRIYPLADAVDRYVATAVATLGPQFSLDGMLIAVDAANGAASRSTPAALNALGAKVSLIHAEPDGTNINARCGSLHPEELANLVRQTGAQAGLAHDGDADRVVLCDESGSILDGDEVMAILALDFLQGNRLNDRTLVATVMSNLGLDECLREQGGRVVRTPVGDRHVVAEMLAHNYNLGGEQSGHFVLRDCATTGDGLVSALHVLRVLRTSQQPLSQLRRALRKYPQKLWNVAVRERRPLGAMPRVGAALETVQAELGLHGRVLLRYSGTETKIRLLIESAQEDQLEPMAERILRPLREEIGTLDS